MIKYRFTDKNGNLWVRISKKEARSLFDHNITVTFCPCNMRPFNTYVDPSVKVNKNDCMITGRFNSSFDSLVNEFEYYNCNHETGRYTAFYKGVTI